MTIFRTGDPLPQRILARRFGMALTQNLRASCRTH